MLSQPNPHYPRGQQGRSRFPRILFRSLVGSVVSLFVVTAAYFAITNSTQLMNGFDAMVSPFQEIARRRLAVRKFFTDCCVGASNDNSDTVVPLIDKIDQSKPRTYYLESAPQLLTKFQQVRIPPNKGIHNDPEGREILIAYLNEQMAGTDLGTNEQRENQRADIAESLADNKVVFLWKTNAKVYAVTLMPC